MTITKQASEVEAGDELVERDGALLEVEAVTTQGRWIRISFRQGCYAVAVQPALVRPMVRVRVMARGVC
jgi:hypothetical protein